MIIGTGLKTSIGIFKIEKVFTNEIEARENNYVLHFTEKMYDIYINKDEYPHKCAVIERHVKSYIYRNGYTTEFICEYDKALQLIEEKINKYNHLNPQVVLKNRVDNLEVIIYQYETLYQEMFTIEYVY